MKNKGFTLVELIAIIIILSVILLISFATLTNVLKENKIKDQEQVYDQIRNAASLYVETNLDDFSSLQEQGSIVSFYVNTLIDKGYIEDNFEDMIECDVNRLYVNVTKNDDNTIGYEVVCGEYGEYVAGNCSFSAGNSWTYSYTGNEAHFAVPCDGTYKLEVWGAQGGSYNSDTCIGGYGGYATGEVELITNHRIYINVGGKGLGDGTHVARAGGYNGGGDATCNGDGNTRQSSGGGATHIATSSGLLSTFSSKKSSLLIVAAGGGGGAGNAATMCVKGGNAGGYVGNDGDTYSEGSWSATGAGATQALGNAFGIGQSVYAVGGGGGYYGGFVESYSGGGGSGYIGNSLLTNKSMYCYECAESNNDSTKTITTTDVDENATSQYAKIGDGYAKITLISAK